MKISPYMRERLACAYFFAVPGLVYGTFTSRLPALKSMVEANDGQIGFLLLAFGAASFAGLIGSRFALAAIGAKRLIGISSIVMVLAMSIAALAFNYPQLVIFCLFAGLAGGLCEVAMNAVGMMIEQHYNRLCMASLHACFSLGGMAGSLGGSLFAAHDLSPALNFLIIAGGYMLLLPLAYTRMGQRDRKAGKREKAGPKSRIPAFIYFCGLVSMLCYVSEGSVGEWGSILLHSVKGAPQDIAALVFGCFCAAMVIFRFLGDRMREAFGDVRIVFFGALLGAIGMTVVLLAKSPIVCLVSYTAMGIGFAPIVPILFSRAGSLKGISPARASSTMSIMSYTGLLVFPPFLGILGDWIGLGQALWIIAAACLCVAISGPFLLRGMACSGRTN